MRWHEIEAGIVVELATIKPVGAEQPLTPEKARARAKRQSQINRQIATAKATGAVKVNDLRAKLADL